MYFCNGRSDGNADLTKIPMDLCGNPSQQARAFRYTLEMIWHEVELELKNRPRPTSKRPAWPAAQNEIGFLPAVNGQTSAKEDPVKVRANARMESSSALVWARRSQTSRPAHKPRIDKLPASASKDTPRFRPSGEARAGRRGQLRSVWPRFV
jgi:hypothetical protein